jgi:hypothetical protein
LIQHFFIVSFPYDFFLQLLSSTFFTKLLAIKDDATCIKVVYLLCAHIRGWVFTREMAIGVVAVIKRRFLNLDAVEARSHTLRVTARAGKLGVRPPPILSLSHL